MLDYALLEALSAVVREGSFERAARVLHVTPSAVSQRLKLLEERIGRVLVTRGQPCAATPTGAVLCRHVEQVALLEQELSERLPDLGSASMAPTLRLAVNADSVATWFVSALGRFNARHRVLFDVVIEDQDHTAALLRAGGVHGAITTLAEPVQGCRSIALGRLRYLATCSPGFFARHFAAGVNRAAFAAAPCLVFTVKDRLHLQFMRKLVRRDVDFPAHWLASVQGFVEACRHGIGWGMHPEPLVRPLLGRGELVELAPGRFVDVELYWQSWRLASPTFGQLSDIIVSEARRELRR